MSERPTFAQAFAEGPAAESLPVTPSPSESSTATPAAATAQPAETTTPADAPLTPVDAAPIPFDRHKSILDGAYKERDALKQELDQMAWAKTVDRAAIEAFSPVAQLYQSDRVGFIRQVMAEGLTDPQTAALLRSEAARVLGSRPSAEPDLSPDIPVYDDTGKEVNRTYSASRMQQIVEKTIQDVLAKDMAPLKADYDSRQRQEQAAKATAELNARVDDIYQEALTVLPGFKEHEADIQKAFATIAGDPAKALRAAWKQVVGHKLGLADQVKAQQLDELKQKASAGSVNPTAAVVPSSRRPASLLDRSLSWE